MNNPRGARGPFPPGPWDAEPDKIQWVDPESGMDCLVVRGPMGAWCGYVGLQEGHPFFEVSYADISYDIAEVHYGLTFSDFCMEDERTQGERVCHVPPPGSSERVWWLGFDCAHHMDVVPGMLHYYEKARSDLRAPLPGLDLGEVYRDVNYARRETTLLARQLRWLIPREVADRTALLALPA